MLGKHQRKQKSDFKGLKPHHGKTYHATEANVQLPLIFKGGAPLLLLLMTHLTQTVSMVKSKHHTHHTHGLSFALLNPIPQLTMPNQRIFFCVTDIHSHYSDQTQTIHLVEINGQLVAFRSSLPYTNVCSRRSYPPHCCRVRCQSLLGEVVTFEYAYPHLW